MDFSSFTLAFNSLVALILSLSIHESAHAFAAFALGDRTAKWHGRLTLNPLAHMDPVGTFLLPMIFIFSGAPLLFGWAKPVPFDTRNLKNPRVGEFLIAIAGPMSNVVLSILFVGVYLYSSSYVETGPLMKTLHKISLPMLRVNAGLAAFNLIPFPPLDGSKIFLPFLPNNIRHTIESTLVPYSFFIIMALLFVGALSWVSTLATGIMSFGMVFWSFVGLV